MRKSKERCRLAILSRSPALVIAAPAATAPAADPGPAAPLHVIRIAVISAAKVVICSVTAVFCSRVRRESP